MVNGSPTTSISKSAVELQGHPVAQVTKGGQSSQQSKSSILVPVQIKFISI
jgi:hypothetical protein